MPIIPQHLISPFTIAKEWAAGEWRFKIVRDDGLIFRPEHHNPVNSVIATNTVVITFFDVNDNSLDFQAIWSENFTFDFGAGEYIDEGESTPQTFTNIAFDSNTDEWVVDDANMPSSVKNSAYVTTNAFRSNLSFLGKNYSGNAGNLGFQVRNNNTRALFVRKTAPQFGGSEQVKQENTNNNLYINSTGAGGISANIWNKNDPSPGGSSVVLNKGKFEVHIPYFQQEASNNKLTNPAGGDLRALNYVEVNQNVLSSVPYNCAYVVGFGVGPLPHISFTQDGSSGSGVFKSSNQLPMNGINEQHYVNHIVCPSTVEKNQFYRITNNYSGIKDQRIADAEAPAALFMEFRSDPIETGGFNPNFWGVAHRLGTPGDTPARVPDEGVFSVNVWLIQDGV